jgi:hypothetical protein
MSSVVFIHIWPNMELEGKTVLSNGRSLDKHKESVAEYSVDEFISF